MLSILLFYGKYIELFTYIQFVKSSLYFYLWYTQDEIMLRKDLLLSETKFGPNSSLDKSNNMFSK